jgi:hypothetical protein
MATEPFNTYVTTLTSATSVSGPNVIYVNQSGLSRQATLTQVGNAIASGATIFNVQNYGAVGNGVTDDTAAINSAIAAFNSMAVGELYFPATTGGYLITSGLTAITARGLVRGQGGGNLWDTTNDPSAGPYLASVIKCNSTTAVAFSVNSGTLTFRDLAIYNTALSTPTSASRGIQNTFTQLDPAINYYNLVVSGFYICVDVQVGAAWVMDGCFIAGPVVGGIALNITNIVNIDAGDWCVSNSVFYDYHHASAGIKQVGSGGGKIVNCKFNNISGIAGFDDCINSTLTSTSDILIANVSFENYFNTAITGSNWNNGVLTNLQIGLGGLNNLAALNFDSCTNCTFGNISFNKTGVGGYAFKFSSLASDCTFSGITTHGNTCKGLIDPTGVVPTFGDNFDLFVDSDVANSTVTMATATGLSATLNPAAGVSTNSLVYGFDIYLSFTDAAAGGIQCQLTASNSLTVYDIVYDGWIIDSAANGIKGNSHATSLGSVVASATTTGTTGVVEIRGSLSIKHGGTMSVQFAQNTSNATATTVKAGSRMKIWRMPMGPVSF